MKTTTLEHAVYTTCSELVIFMYWTGNSMNNVLSYCGLVDARISASEKDLPVHISLIFVHRKTIISLKMLVNEFDHAYSKGIPNHCEGSNQLVNNKVRKNVYSDRVFSCLISHLPGSTVLCIFTWKCFLCLRKDLKANITLFAMGWNRFFKHLKSLYF